jgi:thymidylate kinase
MSKNVFAVEGLDRLGKSTLIEGIRNKYGYFEVIHFSKPVKLDAYKGAVSTVNGVRVPEQHSQAYEYQRAGFLNSMLLTRSGARIIFDRWHLGEAVYSPMYRGYDGDYVFQQEIDTGVAHDFGIRLILLTENFEVAKHFVDDGESLGPIEKREEEQNRFLAALDRSNIKDKRVICVTDLGTGGFRPKEDILAEALEGL